MSRLDPFERGLVAAATAAILVSGIAVAATGAPVAWLLLAVTGFVALPLFVRAIAQRRFFEPLTIVAGVSLLSFSIRPLQLFLGAEDLQSWYPARNLDQAALTLDRGETAQFVTTKLNEALEPALTRTMAAVTLFLVCFVIGYFLPVGRRLRGRIADAGARVPRPNFRTVVLACLAIGLVGQVLTLALAGGPAEAFRGQLDSKVVDAGSPVVNHFLLGFGTIGVLCWAIWFKPQNRLEWTTFAVASLELVVFWSLAGSRTRVLLLIFMVALTTHYLWRAWSRRAVVLAMVGCVLLGAGLLGIRQATYDESIGGAILAAPEYIVDPSGILNDVTEFDILFTATSTIPSERDYAYGGGLVDAFKSYVPGPLIANKPQSTDQEFREFIWQDTQKGGRPYTIIGDFYNDFGFPGIAVGAVLFGLIGRLMLALLKGPEAGRGYRVGLYAVCASIFYMALATAYTLPIGYFIEFAMPFLIAVHLFGPLGNRLGGAFATAEAQTTPGAAA
ncbi:MAG: oligosaccharide repeat unit polymerase [Thermoleophilaceae bacterium]|nr:oligosaccharide repeat unit polymerase [Thermoleophilaceae bacterium]